VTRVSPEESDRGCGKNSDRVAAFTPLSRTERIGAASAICRERDDFLLGCDNNFPNTGRNPARADDNELIIVRVPGLKSLN